MTYKVYKLALQFLDQEWPKIKGYLEEALKYCDELDLSQLRMLIARGDADAFVVFKNETLCGCFVSETVQYPNYRVANVIAAGGKMICNPEFWKVFSPWLKSLGYSKVQCYCRPSVARMINRIDGFKTTHFIVRSDL